MRRKNWRIVITGFALIVIALVFFFFMLSVASKSNESCRVDANGWNSRWCRRGHQPRHDHHRTDRQKGLAAIPMAYR